MEQTQGNNSHREDPPGLRSRQEQGGLCARGIFQNGPHTHSHQRSLCWHHLRARNPPPTTPLGSSDVVERKSTGSEEKQRLVQKSPGRSLLAFQRSKAPSFPAASAHGPEPAFRVEAEGRQGCSHGSPGRKPPGPGDTAGDAAAHLPASTQLSR